MLVPGYGETLPDTLIIVSVSFGSSPGSVIDFLLSHVIKKTEIVN